MRTTRSLLPVIFIALLFVACTANRQRYERVLQRAHEQNQAYDSITNIDSLRLAAEYFDRHGSANERMRAHYLLGCAYRDMGDAPRALEAYHDAADRADTTSNDCDYGLLCRVHSQTGAIFYDQLLPYDDIEEREAQYRYAMYAKDTLSAINAIEKKAEGYELLGMTDSFISIVQHASDLYRKYGYKKEAAMALGPIISSLIDKKQVEEAKKCIDIYVLESGAVVDGELSDSKALFDYYRGLYFLIVDKNDSANYYFRRLLKPSNISDCHEAAYRGLFLLYKQTGNQDSLVKYANLAYKMMESSLAVTAKNDLQRMHSLYNYSQYKRETIKMSEKAYRNKLVSMFAIACCISLLFLGIWFFRQQKMKKKKEMDSMRLKYLQDRAALEEAQHDLMAIKESSYQQLIEEKMMLINMLEERNKKYEESQNIKKRKTTKEELQATDIYKRIQYILRYPTDKMYKKDWEELHQTIDKLIPDFYFQVHSNKRISEEDYRICLLVRLYLANSEIARLIGGKDSTVSMRRKRLLADVFSRSGKAEDFDLLIQKIV